MRVIVVRRYHKRLVHRFWPLRDGTANSYITWNWPLLVLWTPWQPTAHLLTCLLFPCFSVSGGSPTMEPPWALSTSTPRVSEQLSLFILSYPRSGINRQSSLFFLIPRDRPRSQTIIPVPVLITRGIRSETCSKASFFLPVWEEGKHTSHLPHFLASRKRESYEPSPSLPGVQEEGEL